MLIAYIYILKNGKLAVDVCRAKAGHAFRRYYPLTQSSWQRLMYLMWRYGGGADPHCLHTSNEEPSPDKKWAMFIYVEI